MSKHRANPELTSGGPDLERRGRRLGIALFWLLLFFVIGMSSRSILTALFFPHLAPLAGAPDVRRCAGDLSRLERDLTEHTSAALEQGEVQPVRAWLSTWDRKARSLPTGCGPLERARRDLLALRDQLGSLLDAYEAGPLPIQQRLRRVLAAVEPPAASPPLHEAKVTP